MKKTITLFRLELIVLGLFMLAPFTSQAQLDSLFSRSLADTSKTKMVQDALYNRPFIEIAKTSTAIGGYLEGNTNYFSNSGVSEGFSMELRRFNIFLYSSISDRIKFLSELEFEHGTAEIGLETALIDISINSGFNIRTGILVVPIGAYNLNHDSPKWEFIERPLVTTQIIPSTLSEVGFGFHGKFYRRNQVFTYDAYLVNGLQDGIILNEDGRTFLPAGKNPARFGKDNNGSPMLTGKLSYKYRRIGEVGFSYYGGTYNSFRIDGIKAAPKYKLALMAVDFNSSVKRATINGELVMATIQKPVSIGPAFGGRQMGGYAEIVYQVFKGTVLQFENSTFNTNFRVEALDFNRETFTETGTKIYDEVIAVVPGISFRPSANTVLRANYRYHWTRDLLGNPTTRSAGIQVGFASYF